MAILFCEYMMDPPSFPQYMDFYCITSGSARTCTIFFAQKIFMLKNQNVQYSNTTTTSKEKF